MPEDLGEKKSRVNMKLTSSAEEAADFFAQGFAAITGCGNAGIGKQRARKCYT